MATLYATQRIGTQVDNMMLLSLEDTLPDATASNAAELPSSWPTRNSSGKMIDDVHREITMIYFKTKKFAIYEAEGRVYYQLPDDFSTAEQFRSRINDLGGLRASIQDLRNESNIRNSSESLRAGEEIAWALSEAFETQPSLSGTGAVSSIPKDILTRVDNRLRGLVKSHYRKKYVEANIVAFIVFEIVLSLVARYSRQSISVHDYAIISCAGALGALLSVMAGIRSIDIGSDVERWEHWFAGATRILIGVIGAIVVGLALDSQVINVTLGTDNKLLTSAISGAFTGNNFSRFSALILLLGFIAGFSETLVPNVLKKGEDATDAASKSGASDSPIVKDVKP